MPDPKPAAREPFSAFKNLAKKLVQVPKKELDAKRDEDREGRDKPDRKAV